MKVQSRQSVKVLKELHNCKSLENKEKFKLSMTWKLQDKNKNELASLTLPLYMSHMFKVFELS